MNNSFLAVCPFIRFSFLLVITTHLLVWFQSRGNHSSTKGTKIFEFFMSCFIFHYKAALTGHEAVNKWKVPSPLLLILRKHEGRWSLEAPEKNLCCYDLKARHVQEYIILDFVGTFMSFCIVEGFQNSELPGLWELDLCQFIEAQTNQMK